MASQGTARKDVSSKALGLFREFARRRGGPVERFFSDTGVDPDDVPVWVPWGAFAEMCERLAAEVGGPAGLEEVGRTIIDLPDLGRITAVLRLGVSPRSLYWANVKWGGPSLFPSVPSSFEDLSDGRLRIRLRIPDGDRDSPAFFHLNAGLFAVLPRLLGMTDAMVQLEVAPHVATFVVTPPPSMSLASRLRRALRMLLQPSQDAPLQIAFAHLVTQQDHLMQQFRELREARAVADRARVEAEEALRVKSEFLATMSHELRTPLNVIVGMTQFLEQGDLPPTHRGYLATIRTSSGNLLAIINDILDFAQTEAGRLTMSPVDFAVRDLVDDVVEVLAVRAAERQVVLAATFGPGVPETVHGDSRRIGQVLTNLVGNAIKFTERGEVVVRVTVDPQPGDPADRPGLMVRVEDSGIGIDLTTQARLFQPFSQAEGATTRKYGGTGLGLAISRRLVEFMQGSIGVDSVPGHGSTFWFRLPLAVVQGPIERHTTSGPVVVIAEANAATRERLVSELERMGCGARAFATGEQAIDFARLAGRLDVAVIAADLPGIAAGQVEAVLRRLPGRDGVRILRVVPVGGQALERESTRGLATLARPVRGTVLSARMRQLLRESGQFTEAGVALAHPVAAAPARRRILVVEDHPLNQQVAEGLLTRLGHDVRLAGDGREGLAALREATFDAVLMDCQMPEMDGFEATRRWRQIEEPGHRIPIVAMTAFAMPGDRERCLAAGMDDYLTKPVYLEALDAALSRWLNARQPSAPPQEIETKAVAPGDEIARRVEELKPLLGDERVAEFVAMYERESMADLDRIEAALAATDIDAVARAAHRLKGSCRNIGAAAAAALCDDVTVEARRTGTGTPTAEALASMAHLREAVAAAGGKLRHLVGRTDG